MSRGIADNLVDLWLLGFVEILRDPDRGAQAWIAYQQLCFASLAHAVQDIQSEFEASRSLAMETFEYVETLRRWTERQEHLPPEERDPIGVRTLERLSENTATLAALHADVGQIQRALEQIGRQTRLPATPEELLDPLAVRRLFGPAVRFVNLDATPPATPDDVSLYYQGAPLTWSIINARGDIERDQYAELWQLLAAPDRRTRLICLIGEPGAGKTSLAWRLAADLARQTGQPLLHVRDNEASSVWYTMESGVQYYARPLIILVDDVFRSEDAVDGLASLSPDLPLTILATSRSNEVPEDLRLPFTWQMLQLKAPSPEEKDRALHKVSREAARLSLAQRARLDNANSWLVMMLELVTGRELAKIVRDTVRRLQRQDTIVYQAYEYLCSAGQYDLVVPESLLARLDDRGKYFDLVTRPAAHGLIFTDSRRAGSLRVSHPIIAREALVVYRRDPGALVREMLRAVEPGVLEQRLFVLHLLRLMTLAGHRQVVANLLDTEIDLIKQMQQVSGVHELVNLWAALYELLNDDQRASQCMADALEAVPQSAWDWVTYLSLVERRGTAQQKAALIDATGQWLAANPQDYDVRTNYLNLVERRGTAQQKAALIDATGQWLAANPQDVEVRRNYLKLVERQGTPEQKATLIDATGQWLAANPQDVEVRRNYLKLVERRGTPEQIAALIDATAHWLEQNPQDHAVRQSYLAFLISSGNLEALHKTYDQFLGSQEFSAQGMDRGLMNTWARVANHLKDYVNAEMLHRRVLARHRGDVPARIGLAWSLYHQGQKPEALKELNHASWWAENTQADLMVSSYFNLGRYHLLEGNHTAAIEFFSQGIHEDPEFQRAYWELGHALFELQRYDDALEAFELAGIWLPDVVTEEARNELVEMIQLARSHLENEFERS